MLFVDCTPLVDDDTRRYWTAAADTKPTFRVSELLDHWYIKSWFSQRNSGKRMTISEHSGLMYRGQEVMQMLVQPLRCALHELGIRTVDADGKNLNRSKVRDLFFLTITRD